MTKECFVGLGSNLGDRELILKKALFAIEESIGPISGLSQVYETKALVHPQAIRTIQPDFLNAVAQISTSLDPRQVLNALLSIEQRFGRERNSTSGPWAPRLIDLDLIAWDSLVIEEETLRLPHPEMHRRDFVLLPLRDLNPNWAHPILNLDVSTLLSQMRNSGTSPTPVKFTYP